MKLLLTLLAILTGLAGGDAVRAAPAPASAIGSAIALAEAVGEVRAAQQIRHFHIAPPLRFVPDRAAMVRAVTPMPVQVGSPVYGLRLRL